jgi:nucleotide-binding universal stress UspA family protein
MNIIIGTDGSSFAAAAVEEACRITAGRDDVNISVVSAYELPGPPAAEAFVSMPTYTQEIIDGICGAAESIAKEAVATIRKNCPNARVMPKCGMGRPAQLILDEAAAMPADLIVVGSHGFGFWGRALLGSVSNTVVHHAHCSVLVVRAKAEV